MELIGDLYDLGAHPTISEVAPKLLVSVLALSMHTPVYANVLNWVQANFIKVVWKKHPTLSYLGGPIWTSQSWVPSDFEANSLEGRQASEFIRGQFPGRYGAPHTGDTTSSRVATTVEAATHAAHDGVQVRVLWGDDPFAHLDDGTVPTREPPVLSPFWQGFETFAAGSDSGWGGSPAPENSNHGPRAWGSPPPRRLREQKRWRGNRQQWGCTPKRQRRRRGTRITWIQPMPRRGSPGRRR